MLQFVLFILINCLFLILFIRVLGFRLILEIVINFVIWFLFRGM